MYRLTAFRLVNWLHFPDLLRPVSGTTLLTGENGDGKSTILDAMQLALVADLRQVNFNKAVGHQSRERRTLKGYVLWAEKREDDKAPPKYRRSSATSYVLLQFDEALSISEKGLASLAPRPPLVCGVGSEAVAKGGDPVRTHVVIPNMRLADLPLIDPVTRFATPLRDFEAFVKARRGAIATSSADMYLDSLRLQLGRLPRSLFPSLITKGLAFKPMASVRDFVHNFLLEPKPVETGRLVENLVHYEEMARESERAKARLTALDRLVTLGDDLRTKEQARDIAHFVFLRADVEDAADEQAYQASLAGAKARQQADAAERRDLAEERKTKAMLEVERLSRALAADDRVREKESLRAEEQRLEQELHKLQTAEGAVREILGIQRGLLDAVTGSAVPAALLRDAAFRDALDDRSVIGAGPNGPLVAHHRTRLDPEGSLEHRELERWTDSLGHIGRSLGALRFALNRRSGELRREGVRLRAEQEKLAAGRVTYSDALEALRFGVQQAARRGEITLHRPLVPFCELIDSVEPAWQNTVESWLGARRFDLLPDPADYRVVNTWYERHRDACPTSDGRTIRLYGVAVVNMERVLKFNGGRAAQPLSDVVATSNPLAAAYLDYTLGGVQRCDSVDEFGRYERAATKDDFLYRGYRTERVRPQTPVLGHAAREVQRREIEQGIAAVAKQMADLGPLDTWLRTVEQVFQRANQRWPLVADRLAAIEGRHDLEARLTRTRHQIEAIDLSHVAALVAELATAKAVRDQHEKDWLAARDEASQAGWDADQAQKAAEAAERLRGNRTSELAQHFPLPDVNPLWEEHRARFNERALETEGGMKELATNYRRRYNAANTAAQSAWREFAGARLEYEKTYEPIQDVEAVPVAAIRLEAERWRSTKLPEYARQLDERIAAARVQLLDDVLAQLHSHFSELRKTLTTLNRALQTCAFGNDMYEFTWTPSETLRPFHELITALSPAFELAGAQGSAYDILEGDPVLRERLDELLKALTANRVNPLEGLDQVRDYREYFDYDIRVLDGQGKLYLLSRNAGVASGGEVQTPTYVALFASLQQMYGASATMAAQCGLFLVDESFALLDDRRIPALMSFVQQLGLQGILAMPTGREAHFSKYADTILLVSRDAQGVGRVDDAHDLSRTLLPKAPTPAPALAPES